MAKVRRFIHMNPQTANRESETAKIISSRLAALGLEIKTGVARTGVVALLRGERNGPTVALRAGMDAVPIQETAEVDFKSLNPGIMHATGNDLHAAIVLGDGLRPERDEGQDQGERQVHLPAGLRRRAAGRGRRGGPHDQGRRPRQSPRRGRLRPPCLARDHGPGLSSLRAISWPARIRSRSSSADGAPSAPSRRPASTPSSSPPRSSPPSSPSSAAASIRPSPPS